MDEIGLQLDSAKSTASSSNNPFDEHFRKALSSSKKVDDLSESEEKKETVDDMLNTPLILQDIQSAPPSANVIPLTDRATTVTSTRTTRKFKVEKIFKGSLASIPSPSVKIQIIGGKVCLRCKGKTLPGLINKLLKTKSLLTSPSMFCLIILSKLSRQ